MPRPPLLPGAFEPVLSTEAMRAADRRTMEEAGLPGRVLMETAGRGACDAIEARFGPMEGRRVLVLCGPGNNGGDGYVVARVLHARGADVHAVTVGEPATEDARANRDLLRRMAGERLRLEPLDRPEALEATRYHLLVDALLGIGVGTPPRAPIDAFVRWMNAADAPTAALDVPTGLDSETGEAHAPTVRAALTVSMAAYKPGLLLDDGPEHAGEVVVVDIGVPPDLLAEAAAMPGSARRSTDAAVRRLLPTRAHGAHKYTAGRVLVVAGSHAFPGAAVMTAQAAARAGAGAVTVLTPASARPLVAAHLRAVMSVAVAETNDGTMAAAALDTILARAESADAVIIGPGLGQHAGTRALLRVLLARLDRPVVLDADGLSAFAEHRDELPRAGERLGGRLVLTPHEGEFARIADDEALAAGPRLRVVAQWAERLRSVLLLKGAPSLVGHPDGRVDVAAPVSPALATAGTGDVLAGTIAGLLAQQLDPAGAALAALHVGGRAAQRYAEHAAARTMVATDLLDLMPEVLADAR